MKEKFIPLNPDQVSDCAPVSSTEPSYIDETRIHLLRAEKALEESYRLVSYTDLALSKELFQRAYTKHFIEDQEPLDEVGSRIMTHLTYTPMYHDLVVLGELPTTERAKGVYRQTATLGHELVRQQHTFPDKDKRLKILGFLSELAAIASLQRFAINGPGTENWFPALSFHSEDNANRNNPTRINKA